MLLDDELTARINRYTKNGRDIEPMPNLAGHLSSGLENRAAHPRGLKLAALLVQAITNWLESALANQARCRPRVGPRPQHE